MNKRVARRIEDRLEGGPVVVVPGKNGHEPRVYGFAQYVKLQELPKEVKPHAFRKTAIERKDPLRAIDGRVSSRLRRAEIYE